MSRTWERKAVYNTRRWTRLRRQVLERDGFLCRCEVCTRDKLTKGAELVHHVRPWQAGRTRKERERLAFDPANCLSVARDCHAAIHAAEKPPAQLDWQRLVDELIEKEATSCCEAQS